MSVTKKLMQARIALQGKKLSKSGHNKFAGYQYFELGDFIPTVQQIFSELDLCGVVSYGVEFADLTITDIESGSSLTITSPMSTAALKGCHEVQNLGAVQTYIRRYLWVTAMEIVEHDVIDSMTGKDGGKDTGEKVTQTKPTAHDLLVKKLNTAAKNGTKALETAWKALEPLQRKEMAEMLQDLKDAAAMQDAEIATQA